MVSLAAFSLGEKCLGAVQSNDGMVTNYLTSTGSKDVDEVAALTWHLPHLTPSLLLALMTAPLSDPPNFLYQQNTFSFT